MAERFDCYNFASLLDVTKPPVADVVSSFGDISTQAKKIDIWVSQHCINMGYSYVLLIHEGGAVITSAPIDQQTLHAEIFFDGLPAEVPYFICISPSGETQPVATNEIVMKFRSRPTL